MQTIRAVAALVLLAFFGCIRRERPPPPQSYGLGLSRASFRDYGASKVSICTAEPQWLFDELASINGLLDRFLRATEMNEEQHWTREQISLVEEAVGSLPPVLDAHQKNLEAVARCGFYTQRAFPILVERGSQYVSEARTRLEDAPQWVEFVRARAAFEAWRRERPRQQESARQGCGNARKAHIYFAFQDKEGVTRYLFCDGAKVTAVRGQEPELIAPVGLSPAKRRRLKAKSYLEAAKSYPSDAVSRPPVVPEEPASARRGASRDDAG
ncbi:MAG: hypothetical protein ACOZIN_05420 [Myxococcota bacterium]